jgi:hypothetical protein
MTPAAKSIHYFSFYLILMSLTLLIAPNMLLTTFGMPETNEVWIRVVGLLAGLLAVYYMISAKYNYMHFFKATVFTRIGVIVFFTLFVLLKYAHPMLIAIGLIDLAGAIWTYTALKKSQH